MPEDTNTTPVTEEIIPTEPITAAPVAVPEPDAIPEVPAEEERQVEATPAIPEMQPGEAEAPTPAAN